MPSPRIATAVVVLITALALGACTGSIYIPAAGTATPTPAASAAAT